MFRIALLAAFSLGFVSVAEAGSQLNRKERKAYQAEVEAAFPGKVWSLKDLPVKSGFAMYAAYISPLTEVRTDGFTIDGEFQVQTNMVGAQSVWFGVRPNDVLELKDVHFDDDFAVLTFDGIDGSEKRDTKIKLFGPSFSAVKPVLDQLVTVADPVDPSWPEDIKQAIANRQVINGMSKRQAYLVVGEPTGSTVTEEGGKKVEIWTPRGNDGMRIGYGAQVKPTGYPTSLRFEDGKVVGMGTGSGGGVNLDD